MLALIPSNDEAPFIVTSFNNMTNETWAQLLDALDTYRGPAIREICADLTAHLGGFMKRQISVPLYQFETLPREQVRRMELGHPLFESGQACCR